MSSPFSTSMYSPVPTSSTAAWSPSSSSYTNTPNDRYSAQTKSQHAPSRFPDSFLSDVSEGCCPECYSADCVCNSSIHVDATVSTRIQDSRSPDGYAAYGGYGSPTWSGTYAQTVFPTKSPSDSQPFHDDNTGASQYSSISRPEYVSQPMSSSLSSSSADCASFEKSYTASRFGNIGESPGYGDVRSGAHGDGPGASNEMAGAPYQNAQQSAANEPTKCLLGRCENKFFKDVTSFEAHLRNVHCDKLELYKCRLPNCPWPKPFNNMTDLNRHMRRKAHNSDKPYQCLRPDCSEKTKAWARKDKLKQHNDKFH